MIVLQLPWQLMNEIRKILRGNQLLVLFHFEEIFTSTVCANLVLHINARSHFKTAGLQRAFFHPRDNIPCETESEFMLQLSNDVMILRYWVRECKYLLTFTALGQFLWQPSRPRKVYTDVYFLGKTQKDPSLWYRSTVSFPIFYLSWVVFPVNRIFSQPIRTP